MRIAVVGVGGVGGYLGARLLQAGTEVSLVARGAHLEALQRDGLRLESILGDAHVRPAQAVADPASIGPVDCVLVGVKAWQVPAVAPTLRPLLRPGTLVLPLQNGIQAPDELAAALGADHVLGGAVWMSAHVAAAGLVRHVAVVPRVVLGELHGGESDRCAALCATLRDAGLQAEVSPAIRAVLWTKLAFIAAVSGLGAATRLPVGAWRALPETRRLLVGALEETLAVAAAEGVTLAASVVPDTLAYVDSLDPATQASMQRDLAAGRPSELEAQSGAIVARAAAHGLTVPVHAFLYAVLLPQERRARAGA